MHFATSTFVSFHRAAIGASGLVGLLFAMPVAAQGDLLIAPTRIIMDGRGGAEVILSNIGTTEATYRIGIELRRMQPDGSLEPVDAAAANAMETAAMEMIRYAPRRIVLPPGQPQSIRISARPAPELPDGEYRVHMAFNAVPDTTQIVAQDADANPTGLIVKLTPIYGITIPIIVRKGRLTATTALSNPRMVENAQGAQLQIDMARIGEGSTFGELVVTRPGGGDPLFLARGIAIYPEITQRTVSLSIPAEVAPSLKGPLHFEYRELPEAGGKLLAAVDTTLG